MKNLLTILILLTLSLSVYATSKDKDKTLAEEIAGTWTIKNVQKMQGMVIRTKKYTKDGGDPKAYIKRFKGSTVTFNADSTVVLVSPDGKKTLTGTWAFVDDTKYRVKTGTNAPAWDHGHTETVLLLSIKFPTGRSYNIEGEYADRQFGMVKVDGKFSIIDPKYMFKFERVQGEEEATGEEKKKGKRK